MVAVLISVVLLPLLFVSSDGNTQTSQTVLLSVIDAIERLIGFYKASYNDLNLDGFFGLKVIEGQIQSTMQEHEQGEHAGLSLSIIQRLQAVLQEVRWVSERAVSAVRADDESYFNKLGYIIAQPWNLFKTPRKVVPALRWDVTAYRSSENRKLDEHQSDKCMMEITKPAAKAKVPSQVGAGGRRGSQGDRCSLSHKCGLLMTRRGLTDYGITHQLLWTALAERAGCGDQMNKVMRTLGFNSTEHMQQEFCTNNYYEMLTSIHVLMSGTVSPDFQDLFMEQQFVCPSLGFFEFLRKDYLDQILSWQLPSGCFGERLEPEPPAPQNQQQVLQNFPPAEKDPGVLRPPNSLSRIGSLDLRKEGVNLKNLQFLGNIGLGEPDPHQGNLQMGQIARLREQLQHLQQGSRDNAAAWKQAVLQQQQQQPPGLGGERIRIPYSVHQQQQSPQGRVAGNQSPLQKSVNGVNMLQQGSHQSVYKNGPPQLNANAAHMNGVGGLQGHLPFQFPKHTNNNNPPGVPGRLPPDSVPGRRRETFYDKLQNKPPYKSHGNFPSLPEEIFPLKKIPPHAPFRVQDTLHGVAPGHQNVIQNNAASIQLRPETLRDRGVAPDHVHNPVKSPPQVVRVRAEGPRPPFPPAHAPVIRGQPRQRAFAAYQTGQGSQRRLLVEKDMPGGCLSHKTGVAGGALAMYLRYLISPVPLGAFYSTNTHQGFLGIGASYEKIVQFLGHNLEKELTLLDENEDANEEMEDEARNKDDNGGGGGGDEDEREEEGEEVYPDAMEVARQQEKKVVHFGANGGDSALGHPDSDLREDRKDVYTEEEEEEEGPDYIKRFEGADEKPAGAKNQNTEDTEYTYYEEGDGSKGITRKHKPLPVAQPQTPGPLTPSPSSYKAREPALAEKGPTLGHKDSSSPPARALVVLLSATSLVLIFLVCKFLRKRRIYLKYGSRAFLRL